MHLKMKYTTPHFSLDGVKQFDSPLDVIQHYLNGDDVLKESGGKEVHLIAPLIREDTIKSR